MARSRSGDGFDDALARELARELDEADSADAAIAAKAALIREGSTKPQLDLIDDPSKRRAGRCPRRAGKTTGAGRLIAHHHATHRDAIAWYIATTLKSARKLMWNPMRKLSRELSLGLQFHKTDATVTWPNDAQMWLAGADDRDSINELLGHAPSIAVIDECASFSPDDFEYLLHEVLEPSLMDNDGILVLISTPGTMLAGLHYDITGPGGEQVLTLPDGRHALSRNYRERRAPKWKGVTYEWSLHTWTLKENTARPDLWEKAKALKKRKGWSDKNPIWRRQYLGEWVEADERLRVFGYDAARDTWTPGPKHDKNPFGLPEEHSWRHVIGLDMGSFDPMALQVSAFSPSSPLLLHAHEWESDVNARITTGELARAILDIVEMCGGWDRVEEIVGDHGQLGDTILETLLQEHGIYVEPADKKNKLDHIELTNGELKDGRKKILKDSRLAREMALLQWDPKRPGKYKSGVPNNNTDADLYLSTRARDRNSQLPGAGLKPGTPEAKAEALREEAERYLAAKRKKTEPLKARLEIDWEETKEWDAT